MTELNKFNLQFFGGEGEGKEAGKDGKPTEKTYTQSDFDKMKLKIEATTAAKYKDYDDLKTKADKLDQLEKESGTELEKTTRRAELAERKAAELEAKIAGIELDNVKKEALEKAGLPTSLYKRVIGATPEEIAADIDDLAKTFGGKSAEGGDKKKEESKSPHGGGPVNPGKPSETSETEEERGKRMYRERHEGKKPEEGTWIPDGWKTK